MKWTLERLRATGMLATCAWVATPAITLAQDIEPRAYSNAPIGINFLGLGYAQAESARYKTSTEVVGYSHIFALGGQSARVDVVLPYAQLSGSVPVAGYSVNRTTDGLTDPLVRLSVNFYGAPAMTLQEFADYKQDLILGASLTASAPWGQYDNNQLVNIGANRWFIQPGIGGSKAIGPWKFELAAAATIFTDNNDFFGSNSRTQKPIYSTTGHVIYSFQSGPWISVDATYLTGGQTAINGKWNDDLQENWRLGGTLSLPINKNNSIKLYAGMGVFSRTGNNYDLVGVTWQYRWGAGL